MKIGQNSTRNPMVPSDLAYHAWFKSCAGFFENVSKACSKLNTSNQDLPLFNWLYYCFISRCLTSQSPIFYSILKTVTDLVPWLVCRPEPVLVWTACKEGTSVLRNKKPGPPCPAGPPWLAGACQTSAGVAHTQPAGPSLKIQVLR